MRISLKKNKIYLCIGIIFIIVLLVIFKSKKPEIEFEKEIVHLSNEIKLPPTERVLVPMAEQKRNNDNEKNINIAAPKHHNDIKREMPGENGKPVIIVEKNLTKEEKAKFDLGWKNNAFNEYASNMISIHRNLPDMRDAECKKYKYAAKLPQTSVILCFHNEAWSVLLRSVHSIINRSPKHLLKEVVLVDDFSNMEHLKKPLEEYMSQLKIVKIVRATKREGLIRARLLGANAATGEVLTFLDSHIECTEGWLEPLLDPIAQDWRNVTVPVIDVIADDTLQFMHSSANQVQVGGFSWNLIFNWHVIPERDKIGRKPTDPVNTPTMAGGLFSIGKKFFDYLGGYDPGFDIWGGENLELSFKIWMCGGIMRIVPCSSVGHIFRKRSPYSWKPKVNVLKNNLVRLAEVWLDEYKEFYYMRINNDLGDYGDISERKALRKSLNCKSFKWYLDNIYPDLFVPSDALHSGEIRNMAKPMCVDGNIDSHDQTVPIISFPCHNQGGNQFWMLSKTGEIRRDLSCLDFDGKKLTGFPCHGSLGNQFWKYMESKQIRQMNHNLCLELAEKDDKLIMAPCSNSMRQKWQFPVNPKRPTV